VKSKTLIVTGVPLFLTQGSLLALFEDRMSSMRGVYDFFHCPWDDYMGRNLGYAIINFPLEQDAIAFARKWANYELCPGCPLRVANAARQGRKSNIEHFSRLRWSTEPRCWPLFRGATGMLEPLQG
jgi:hypothetical protein